ncbi:MAG: sugar transferase [Lachnospiraceae bacterium]|nr:sugar transferase [Lachnospiraceae bacterium]
MGKHNKGASTNLIHIIADCAFAMLAFLLAILISCISNNSRNGVFEVPALAKQPMFGNTTFMYFMIVVVFVFVYLLSNKESRLYNVTTFFYGDRIFRLITKSFLFALAVEVILVFYIGEVKLDTAFCVSFLVLTYLFMLISAYVTWRYIKHSNRFAPRTLMVGEIERYETFEKFLSKGNTDINCVGYVSIWPTSDKRYLGALQDFEKIIHEQGIDQVYMMSLKGDGVDVQHYLDHCIEMGVTFRLVMDEYKGQSAQSYVSSVGTYPVITWHTVSLNSSAKAAKRVMDIIGSLAGIILSSPIMLITAIAIKLDSKGPVIFKQKRIGQNGRHFYMYKFRSMCNDAEALKKQLAAQNEMQGGFMFKIHDDPRITKVGKFIRKTSIDELPQFFNVLRGDMSLVGTRPPTLDEVDRYARNHWRRMSIKPGITGMWQVSGRSSITDFNEIVQLDTEYIDKWNVFMDIRILFLTVLKVFKHDGAC